MAESEETFTEQENKPVPVLPPAPRENLISTAVKFLQNPQVTNSTVSQRKAFLAKKGLTDEEVRLAIERSGIPTNTLNGSVIHSSYEPAGPPTSIWSRIKDFIQAAIVAGGIGYAIYHLYKKYVMPYLFGPNKDEKKLDSLQTCVVQLDDSLKLMTKRMDEIGQSIGKQEDDIKAILQESAFNRGPAELNRLQDAQFVKEIKSEITSLKGLLLSRKQFPQTPKTGPILPSWQLSASDNAKEDSAKVNSVDEAKADAEESSGDRDEAEEQDGEKSVGNSEISSQDSETVLHKPVSSTSVDSDFQNGVVVNATSSSNSVGEDKSTTNTEINKEDS